MRIFKLIIYGLLYLIIIIAVIFGLYILVMPDNSSCFDGKQNQGETGVDCGGPCDLCEIKDLIPIQVSNIDIFDIGDGMSSILLEFRNPNHSFGAYVYEFDLVLYSSTNEILYQQEISTLVYPSEVKRMVLPKVKVEAGRVFRSETLLKELEWAPVLDFFNPSSQIRELRVQLLSPDKLLITGILKNDNQFFVSKAYVNAVVLNKNRQVVGLSRTVATSLSPKQERFFQVTMIPFVEATEDDLLKPQLSIELIR